MYGLVNQAIADLIRSQHGDEVWEDIAEQAGSDEDFICMDSYPDELTYRLVGAVSQQLSLPPEAVLEAFGEYWTEYTGRAGYGALFEQSGTTVREFLGNLNRLHAQVQISFSSLRPPRFDLEDLEEGRFRAHYHSERDGLAPMVIGLLRGLAKVTGESVTVTHEQHRAEHGHDVFLITALPQP